LRRCAAHPFLKHDSARRDQIRSLNQSVAELEKTIADEGSKLSSLRLSLPIEG
jgi:hypothetical protein